MKVLFLAAEAAPLVKVGGLGDVGGELPLALHAQGVDIRLALPLYTTIDRTKHGLEAIASVEVPHEQGPQTATIFETRIQGVSVWLVDGAPVQASPGVYNEMTADAAKFTFANLAAIKTCERLGWIPDIVHAHDWHAAVAVMCLTKLREVDPRWRETGSLYTIHNLPYMGVGAEAAVEAYQVPVVDSNLLPGWARKVPLAQGILQADWVSTVSPTYAREIQTPDFGSGLEALLGARSAHLSGILNGIDPQVWDPGSDQALERRYGLSNLPERNANKAALQSELGLKPNPRIPMLGMVARFDPQKGLDLVWPALEGLSSSGWQFVLLGTGDPALEQLSQAYAEKMSGQVRVVLQFASSLARRIYAGSDMLLVPSRYEPCGLTQMIAMRYGCVPIVRATGGLLDTVIDLDPSGEGTGFVFQDASIEALQSAIGRALDVYVQPERWARLQQSGMRQDFSWTRSAGEYMKLYQTIRQRHAD